MASVVVAELLVCGAAPSLNEGSLLMTLVVVTELLGLACVDKSLVGRGDGDIRGVVPSASHNNTALPRCSSSLQP